MAGEMATAAVAYQRSADVDVVEGEAAVIGWHNRHWRQMSGPALQGLQRIPAEIVRLLAAGCDIPGVIAI